MEVVEWGVGVEVGWVWGGGGGMGCRSGGRAGVGWRWWNGV